MADISRIKTINGTTYDIKDAVARKKADIYYVPASDTDATAGVWTGSLDGLSAYYDGLTIIFVPKVAGVTGGVTLNINSLGAVPCYLTDKGAIAVLTTHYPVGTPIPFTYVDGKFIHADYSRANDNTTNISTLNYGSAHFVANSAIYRYQLLFQMDDDTLTPLNNVSNGYSKTNKAILTNVEFDPFKPIRYYYATTTVAANGTLGGASLVFMYATVDLRYSLNISATVNALSAGSDVYMKVSPQENGKVKLAAAFPLTQVLPVSDDGYWYIFLGRAYSTYQINLYPEHPVYKHNGTSVVQIFYGTSEFETASHASSTYAPKASPVFTGSISLGRKENTTVGSGSVAEGSGVTASGNNSHAEGYNTTASAASCHAEGISTNASEAYAHAEGYETAASNIASHAEGNGTTASGNASHAEGQDSVASGLAAHAEGETCTASNEYSHAEGYHTTAAGSRSHAEGTYTLASGSFSHAQGRYTIASGLGTHVFGEHNIDSNASVASNPSYRGTMVEIVGNGLSPTQRSNARTLDWSGNETLAGTLTCQTSITIGNTTITEAQLATLVSLAAANGVSF